ncbi:MAG: hypothetical protein LBC96_09525 [Lachnospiraceae bacterium]|jgi:hypothetical protein|nr:hypothetical protein [Lachnospiraceae bacterium]
MKKTVTLLSLLILTLTITACKSGSILPPDFDDIADGYGSLIDIPGDGVFHDDPHHDHYYPADTNINATAGTTLQTAYSDGVLVFVFFDERLHEVYDTSQDRYKQVLFALEFKAYYEEYEFQNLNLIGLHINDSYEQPGVMTEGSIMPHMHEVIKHAQYHIDFAAQTVTLVLELHDHQIDTVLAWEYYHMQLFVRIGDYESGNEYINAIDYNGNMTALLSSFSLFKDNDPLAHIPERGTSPYVSFPLDQHDGDRGYFFATSDDYIVYVIDSVWGGEMPEIPYRHYYIVSFDENGDFMSAYMKRVFESVADAEEIANRAGQSAFIQLENVIFYDWDGNGSSIFMPSPYMATKQLAFDTLLEEPTMINEDGIYWWHVSQWVD